MGLIYCLYSAQDGRPRYIGQTTKPLLKRLDQHMAKADQHAQAPLYCWIRAMRDSGFQVRAHGIQEGVVYSDLDRFERYWMEQFAGLLNATRGMPQVVKDSAVGSMLQRGLYKTLALVPLPPEIDREASAKIC